MYGYIYKTTDLTNNKIYVGKKVSKKFLGTKYVGYGLIIYRIKDNLKEQNVSLEERFSVEMIDSADSKDELIEKEIFWIDKLQARDPNIGYNLRKGGDCGPGGPMFKGHKHTEETKQHLKEVHTGMKQAHWNHTPDMKYDFKGEKNSMFGKHHKDSTKEKNW